MESSPHKFVLALGASYHVRTVTDHWTGKLVSFDADFLVLDQSAWIADTGRFTQFLAKGKADEVEPCPGLCFINRAAICAVIPWSHPLPREQK